MATIETHKADAKMTTEILAEFHNTEDAMTAFVTTHPLHGQFGVSLRDDDSGSFVPVGFRFPTLEAAIAKARFILNLHASIENGAE